MEVSPEELRELLQRPGPRAFHLVDVRDMNDFIISRLDWAELLSASRVATEAPKRFPDKSRPIVFYCGDGSISRQVSEVLEQQGYEFTFHLAGGLKAWKKQVDPSFVLEDTLEPPPPFPSAARPLPPSSTSRPAVPSTSSSFSWHEVSPEELHELLNRPSPRDFRLIDVREEDEFQICRLDWAELIPLAQLSEQAPRRLVDKDRPLVVYCHHGMRSQHACDWLSRAGYLHVYNLTGGIDAWADRVDGGMRRY